MTLKHLFASSPSQTRSRFEATRSEVHELMKRIREAPQEYRQTSPISCEGYLYVQEKRKNTSVPLLWTVPGPCVTCVLGLCRATSLWFKLGETLLYICERAEDPAHGDLRPQIWREARELPQNGLRCHNAAFPALQDSNINVITDCFFSFFFQGETESVTLKSCVRKTTDVLDRRFCLDLDITDRYIFADAVSPSQCCRHKSSMIYFLTLLFFCSHSTATLHYFNKYFILPRSIALCRFSVKIPAHTSIWIRMSKVIQSVLS